MIIGVTKLQTCMILTNELHHVGDPYIRKPCSNIWYDMTCDICMYNYVHFYVGGTVGCNYVIKPCYNTHIYGRMYDIIKCLLIITLFFGMIDTEVSNKTEEPTDHPTPH